VQLESLAELLETMELLLMDVSVLRPLGPHTHLVVACFLLACPVVLSKL
jgi:hypothetical protein